MAKPASNPYLIAWARVAAHFRDGQLEDALRLVRQMQKDFPARAVALSHAEACILARAGDADAGFEVMRKLVQTGRWWSRRQLADPDLAPLSELHGYSQAVTEMARQSELALEAARACRPRVLVDRPETTARGTAVVLHMMGISGRETASVWAPVTSTGIAVVTVESSLSNGDGLPCWDDLALAERDVCDGVDAARGLGAPVVLAGGSQGAAVAAILALGGAIKDLAGLVCVVGAPASGTWTINTLLPTLLIAGGDDLFTVDRQRQFRDDLTAAGSDVEYVEVPHLPHIYPSDWATLARPMIELLLTRAS